MSDFSSAANFADALLDLIDEEPELLEPPTPPAESALPAGQARQLGVMIAWRENERDTSTGPVGYKDDIDATKVRAADRTLSAGGGADTTINSCPADHTCHLQYIPVPSRCAPYAPGIGVPLYYCPGS